MSDSRSFGNPLKLYTEIQVMGVLPDGNRELAALPDGLDEENHTVIRSARAEEWELVQIGEIRAQNRMPAAQEAEQVTAQLF